MSGLNTSDITSLGSGESILTGSWYNYNGTTMWDTQLYTMTARNWSYFNNFLVIFLTIVAERLWFILSYFIYQASSHSQPRDGLRRSTDVLLRNMSNMNIIVQLPWLIYHWSGANRWPRLSSFKAFAILWLAIGNLFGFQAAAIFLSHIKAHNLAPVRSSDSCGIYLPDRQAQSDLMSYSVQEIESAASLRSQYLTPSSNGFANEFFRIKNRTIECPFKDRMCLYSDMELDKNDLNNPVSLDTGRVSIRSFGINSKEDLEVRRVYNCSALNTNRFEYQNNLTLQRATTENDLILPARYAFRYFFGFAGNQIRYGKEVMNYDLKNGSNKWYLQKDTTYIFLSDHLNLDTISVWGETHRQSLSHIRGEYTVYDVNKEKDVPVDLWLPKEEFWSKGDQMDLSILFISWNRLFWTKPQPDNMIRATEMEIIKRHPELYRQSQKEPVNVIACAQQIQVCNPERRNLRSQDSRRCTNLTYIQSFGESASENDSTTGFPSASIQSLELSELQIDLLNSYLTVADRWYPLGDLAKLRRNKLLKAERDIMGGESKGVSPGHWREELAHMIRFSLIGTMHELRLYASGLNAPLFKDPNIQTGELKRLTGTPPKDRDPICKQNLIIINSPLEHVTLRRVSIILILSIGGTIIIVSLLLEPLYSTLLRVHPKHRIGILAWRLDNVLQLFRFTMESAGIDTWKTGLISDTPVTYDKSCKMAVVEEQGVTVRFVRLANKAFMGEGYLSSSGRKGFASFEDLDSQQVDSKSLLELKYVT